jgi:hypothetical protein
MNDTLPTLDQVERERYQHALAGLSYAALQEQRIALAVRALSGDWICAQLLPIVSAEADARPEGKAAELLRQEWRVESWLHPDRRRSAPAWRLAEYDPAADIGTAEPLDDEPIEQCHPSIAFIEFIDHIPQAAAARRRLVLREA